MPWEFLEIWGSTYLPIGKIRTIFSKPWEPGFWQHNPATSLTVSRNNPSFTGIMSNSHVSLISARNRQFANCDWGTIIWQGSWNFGGRLQRTQESRRQAEWLHRMGHDRNRRDLIFMEIDTLVSSPRVSVCLSILARKSANFQCQLWLS